MCLFLQCCVFLFYHSAKTPQICVHAATRTVGAHWLARPDNYAGKQLHLQILTHLWSSSRETKTTKTKNTQNPAKMRNHSFGSMECQAKLTNWPSHWHCLWIKEHNESKERCKERMHSATFLERTIINETTAETVSNSLEWTTINETTTETFQTPLNEPSSMKPIIKLFQTPFNEPPSVRPILKLFQTPLNEPSSIRPINKLFQTPLNGPPSVRQILKLFQTPLNGPSSMRPIIKLFQTPLNGPPSVRPILKLFQTPLNGPSSMRPIIKLFQRHKQWGHIWEMEFEHITRDFQGWANKIRLFIVHA